MRSDRAPRRCLRERPERVDLVRPKRARLAEASAAGLDAHDLQADVGKPRRIHDVVRASLPAAPPSRFRFVTDVPADGRLVLAAGIPGRYHDASAVEFVASVRRRGRDETVLSCLVDPAKARPEAPLPRPRCRRGRLSVPSPAVGGLGVSALGYLP